MRLKIAPGNLSEAPRPLALSNSALSPGGRADVWLSLNWTATVPTRPTSPVSNLARSCSAPKSLDRLYSIDRQHESIHHEYPLGGIRNLKQTGETYRLC